MPSSARSVAMLERALCTIPWGTQTNAKRPLPGMEGAMPYFIRRGRGCRLYDIDGREFIDYRASLGPIILGYCYPAVDDAVRAQMQEGVLFSMAHPVEVEVAEAISAAVPGAEKVRFLKTGADSASAALRIARVYTGRQKFISCGYHGWVDAFAAAGQGMDRGVPDGLRDYVYSIPYGDADAAERLMAEHGSDIAAIFTVPHDLGDADGAAFLRRLRQIATTGGALLIFDEIITGFRFARGGAAEYYGVTPDLTVLGKAMANGYPLTAFAGAAAAMSVLDQNRALITTTYAGETLSLAACKATLDVMAAEPVHNHIWHLGERLKAGFDEAGRATGVPLRAFGPAPCSGLAFAIDDKGDRERVESAFNRAMFLQGIFANVHWFITYSHTEADIDETIEKAAVALRAAAG